MAKSKKSEIDGLRPSRKKAKRGGLRPSRNKAKFNFGVKITIFPTVGFQRKFAHVFLGYLTLSVRLDLSFCLNKFRNI